MYAGTRVVTLPQEDQDKIDAMHVRLDNHEKELEYRRAIRAAELESGQLDEVPDEKSSTEDIDHTNDEKIQPSGLKNFISRVNFEHFYKFLSPETIFELRLSFYFV